MSAWICLTSQGLIQSGARSAERGGMIERLWLQSSECATLAWFACTLLWRACFLATCARNVHSAFASTVLSTCNLRWLMAIISVYVASHRVTPVLRVKSSLASAYRGHCAIACLFVSTWSWHAACEHLPLWVVYALSLVAHARTCWCTIWPRWFPHIVDLGSMAVPCVRLIASYSCTLYRGCLYRGLSYRS